MDESRLDRDELRRRLREAKQRLNNDPEFLARFDVGGDGIVDGEEWEAVRAWVIEEMQMEAVAPHGEGGGYVSQHERESAYPQMYGDTPQGAPGVAPMRTGRAVIIDNGPFDVDVQGGAVLARIAMALGLAFVLPVIRVSFSAPGGSQSQSIWLWEVNGASLLYAFVPILAAIVLAFLATRFEDREAAVKIGGVVGVVGFISLFFMPDVNAGGPGASASAQVDSFGDLIALAIIGAAAFALGAHHRLRNPTTVFGRGLLVLGALCVAIAFFVPQELTSLQVGQGGPEGATEKTGTLFHVWSAFGSWLDIPSEFRSPISTLGFLIVMLTCTVFVIVALVAVFSVFVEQDEDRRELMDRVIRLSGIGFLATASLGAFFILYGFGGLLERILEQAGQGSVSISILPTGFISIALTTSAYTLLIAQGMSLVLDRFEEG